MKESYDISARGSYVIIEDVTKGSKIYITDFADDQDPITIDDVNIAEGFYDANGKLCRRGKIEPVNCHIAVIPSSDGELAMNEFVLNNLTLTNGSAYSTCNMTVFYRSGKKTEFCNGFLTSSSMGYAATSAGRIRTKNYSFCFETCNVVAGA